MYFIWGFDYILTNYKFRKRTWLLVNTYLAKGRTSTFRLTFNVYCSSCSWWICSQNPHNMCVYIYIYVYVNYIYIYIIHMTRRRCERYGPASTSRVRTCNVKSSFSSSYVLLYTHTCVYVCMCVCVYIYIYIYVCVCLASRPSGRRWSSALREATYD